MKFKDITEKDIEYIIKVRKREDYNWEYKEQLLSSYFGKSTRTVRRWLKKLGITQNNDPIEESDEFLKAKSRVLNTNRQVFFATWAQAQTPVHRRLLDNILTYGDYRNADLHVIAGRYKNPTSLTSSANTKANEWWVSDVKQYLDANRHDVHPLLTMLSDIKVQPTASNPLSGFDSVSGVKSAIIGHPKVHLKCMPVLEGHPFKTIATTGAVTVPNYTDTKAGAKGEFHHTFGFAIIEVENQDIVHIRQVTANPDGSFYDLGKYVSNGKVYDADEIGHIVLGDLHPHILDYNFYNVGILDFLDKFRPNHTIIHDIFDGNSISHWHEKDPIKMWQKTQAGDNRLMYEIEKMLEVVKPLIKYNPIVARSNHDDFLDRWIMRNDWKKDLVNAHAYIKMVDLLMSGKAPKGLIPYYLNEEFGDDIKCLGRDESCIINKIELSNHGDRGLNGAKGSLNSYSKLNTKLTIGHSHTPGRMDGAIQVGTSTILRPDYVEGPSSWRQAHSIGHVDGKRQLILFSENYTYTTFND